MALSFNNAADLKGLSAKEKLPLVLHILDMNQVVHNHQSLYAGDRGTIETWPQLGSAVTLGGAVITDTARRILLGICRVQAVSYRPGNAGATSVRCDVI